MEAVNQARAWQDEAKRLYEQRCQEVVKAEAAHNEAIKRTLDMTEALEKRVKTVTMRVESLATTEADFFQTLLERQKETQRNLNDLSAPLCPRTAQQETRSAA